MQLKNATKVLLITLFISGCGTDREPVKEVARPDPTAALREGFLNPPAEARPRVWWHWMNGNISLEGIRADMEWMSRVGIGGLQHFDAALRTEQIVEERLVYMTPEWKAAFRFAAEQAEARDLELAIAGSPGWSETGGPWVPPEDGMKKLVWSEATLAAGRRFDGPLPPLPDTAGKYQDMAFHDEMLMRSESEGLPRFARDIAVLAYRPPGETSPLPQPRFSTESGEPLDGALLTDGRYENSVKVAKGTREAPAIIALRYEQPQVVSSLNFFLPGATGVIQGSGVEASLETSEDGENWQQVADVPLADVPTTVNFSEIQARHFRILLTPAAGSSIRDAMAGGMASGVDALSMFSVFGVGESDISKAVQGADHYLAEFALGNERRVEQFELKAGFSVASDYYALSPSETPRERAVQPGDIIDLTGRVTADGHLDWTPPEGRWKILRLGYSLTGKSNHPAPPEATGLEVDKFDGAAVRRYLEIYLDNYRDAAGEQLVGKRGLQALLTDSIEVGAANWTPALREQFRRLRGYDPLPWLPVLTGVVVGSGPESDAFLYDFRRTLADLIASEHYGTIAEVTSEQGLTYYSEAVETIRTTLGDDMAMRSHADVPMAAMWTYGKSGPIPGYILDIRGAASVANIYGQNLVAAESLTSMLQPWASAPADLRPVMDLIFAHGVNRPVIHTSVHQPADDKVPGLALLVFGQYFNRHETWAEMAKPWVDYMARSSFLLQQGRNHADVAYFYGEEAPLTKLFEQGLPADAPRRYPFDFINADALLGAVTIDSGELVTTGGARYRLLYLGGSSRYMTLPVLRRLGQLVEAGATVVGRRPQASPSLADDQEAFDALVKRLWGANESNESGGMVIDSSDPEAVLASLGVKPDFSFEGSGGESEVLFRHRRMKDGDLYFLSNRSDERQTGEARFRVSGRAPEIWRADTGETGPVSYRIENGQTIVDLEMAPQDAFFVVLTRPTEANSATVDLPQWQQLADIGSGEWSVDFQPGRGAPAGVTLNELTPLNKHDDPGIRYFSGVAAYTRSFDLPAGVTPGQPLQLDLGEIGDVAEVYINDELVGTAWREPYRVEIGPLVQAGANSLEIRVANLWVNRLIGDVQPNAERVTWTSTPVYLPNAPLRRSGLIGPVTLLGRTP